MTDNSEQIRRLQARLDKMVEYQNYFYREINLIREEIKQLKTIQTQQIPPETPKKPPVREDTSFYKPPPLKRPPIRTQPASEQKSNYQTSSQPEAQNFGYSPNYQSSAYQKNPPFAQKSNVEEFVGKNLISLIGIIITVIGVAIGAKYAIDRDLISPAMRIILGYVFAFATFGIALRLKAKYHNFSAVLLSGAMAMMYFLTYFAYGFYDLIPQTAAFAMMVLITAFTVAAAIQYNRQVIAHIGLVGAYAVPFLLSDGSGRVAILFSYMTLVNFGILLISVKKFWKPLYYTSFIFTWLIFSAWYFAQYKSAEHFTLAFVFLSIFFATFYLTFVSYKLIADEEFNTEIVLLVLVNSFIFYGFGYSILNRDPQTEQFLGLFTIANSFIHLLFAIVIKRFKLGGKINLYLPVALALVFLTIAFPVQTDGKWNTLFWTAEAAILFAIGRIKRISIFEIFSYPLMALASVSLLNDWGIALLNEAVLIPFWNKDFLVSAFFTIAFAAICYINKREEDAAIALSDLQKIINFILPSIFLFALYNTFRTEIGNYFHGEIVRTAVSIPPRFDYDFATNLENSSLKYFNLIWQINYTMFFLTLLSFINIRKFQSKTLGFINICLNSFLIFIFLSIGLYFLSELRENYLLQKNSEFFNRDIFHLVIRYISYVFAFGLIFANYKYFKQKFLRETIPDFPFDFVFDFGFYLTMLWILSSELLNLMDIFAVADSYKLGLSILWGIYALGLIIIGIYQKKKHLRIGAIILFAITLVKLFFYDIADLDTISKTIVFVSLGILLLVISFLYNKFKDTIFAED